MRWLRWLRWTLLVVAGFAVLAAGLGWWAMRQSLPQIEGEASLPGLAAEATIERDTRGIPVITAASRTDLAFATGAQPGIFYPAFRGRPALWWFGASAGSRASLRRLAPGGLAILAKHKIPIAVQ